MDLIQLVVIAMVLTILVTLTLAAVSYGAFKLRSRNGPARPDEEAAGPLFFERVAFRRDPAGGR